MPLSVDLDAVFTIYPIAFALLTIGMMIARPAQMSIGIW
jgi:hypothetical protein